MEAKRANDCYHCGLPVPSYFKQQLDVLGQTREFCCLGCFSVAETIVNSGLTDYYKFRTDQAITPDQELPSELMVYDEQDIQQDYLLEDSSQNSAHILLLCEAIRCSACAWLVERKIGQTAGVTSIKVNVSAQTISLNWQQSDVALSEILKRLHQLGYSALPYKTEIAIEQQQLQQKSWLRRLGLAGLGMMQVMMYAVALYIGVFDDMSAEHRSFLRWVSFLVATPVLLYAGKPFYLSAFRALKQLQLNMDVPITLALFLAYFASIWATIQNSGEVYFDSVTMFVFFLLIGRYLEFRARQLVSEKVYRGHSHLPNVVQLQVQESNYRATARKKIQIGDRLLVKAGETIALDGNVVSGDSQVNEALLNGEFMPVHKGIGDAVLAGSVNTHQALLIEVTSRPDDSYWSKLLSMQEQALLEKPAIGLLADKVARYFVLFILLLAIAVAWYWSRVEPSNALWITLSVLVVSCPCALSLATPIAMTCGSLALNQHNVLIKGQHFLSNASHVTDVIFDKTGTLTQGLLEIDEVAVRTVTSKEELLCIIAQLESQSEHPIAKAFAPFLPKKVEVEMLQQHPFAGVSGIVRGTKYFFGNQQFIQSVTTQTFSQFDTDLENDQSYLWLATDESLVGKVLLKDKVREHAAQLMTQLTQQGIELHLLSGDPSKQVQKLAQDLSIQHWKNSMQPEQKLTYLQQLQQANKRVMVIGDGVNDAPVMAAADASVAMANAADLTRISSDAYLMSGKLLDVGFIVNKSRHTQTVIKQNLAWALFYNALMIPFAASGYIAPYVAAIGMSFSSIVVVLNSLKLKR
ncbi:MAG: heavy metal translocating P-type ATPase [Kangiellaceae bacterium]|nr:heavy metal translocating P-type ATPase [Kangiellaceae bacterium]